jgi:hypothetical protein
MGQVSPDAAKPGTIKKTGPRATMVPLFCCNFTTIVFLAAASVECGWILAGVTGIWVLMSRDRESDCQHDARWARLSL